MDRLLFAVRMKDTEHRSGLSPASLGRCITPMGTRTVVVSGAKSFGSTATVACRPPFFLRMSTGEHRVSRQCRLRPGLPGRVLRELSDFCGARSSGCASKSEAFAHGGRSATFLCCEVSRSTTESHQRCTAFIRRPSHVLDSPLAAFFRFSSFHRSESWAQAERTRYSSDEVLRLLVRFCTYFEQHLTPAS